MMSRKKAIIILASVWCIAFVSLVFNWLQDGEKKGDIVTAFAARNYLSTNGVVSVYADYGNKYMSVEEKEEILKKLAIAVGIDEDIEFVSEREERDGGYMATTSYSTYNNYSTTDIRIVTVESEGEAGIIYLEQYILMELSIDNSVESAVYYQDKIKNAFEQMNIDADVTLGLKGCVQGTLSNAKKNAICEDIIKDLNGEMVIGGGDGEVYTIYGYTEDIEDYVLNGTIKSNITVMITYDKASDITWIQVGTPIIN